MARRASTQPTAGQLEILAVLWESAPAELGAICAALRRRRPVATSTVATMLTLMLEKGLVKRAEGPRGYLWSARVSRRQASSGLVKELIDKAFDGSAKLLVAHLVESGKLSPDDHAEIRRLLDTSGRRSGPR